MQSSTPLASARLGLTAKRKRASDEDGTGAAAGSSSSTLLQLQTPRPRPLPSALMASSAATPAAHAHSHLLSLHASSTPSAPATPLLSMPSPSSELMPVLAQRAQRQSALEGSAAHAPATPSASGLLSRSASLSASQLLTLHASSGGGGGAQTLLATPSSSSAAASALASAAASAARQAESSLSLDRERALRLQVEELRAEVRTRISAQEEESIKAQQRLSKAEAAQTDKEVELDKLRAQLRFLHAEEASATATVRAQAAQLAALESSSRADRAELQRLRAQVRVGASPSSSSPSERDDDAAAGEVSHLRAQLSLQSSTVAELERRLADADARISELSDVQHSLEVSEAQRQHAELRCRDLTAQLQSHARESDQLAQLQARAGEFAEQTAQLQRAQAEAARLRAQKLNFALQQEQLLAASAKVTRLEADRQAQAQLTLECEALRKQLDEWESSVQALGLQVEESKEEETADDSQMNGSLGSKSAAARKRSITPAPFLASYQQLQATNLSLAARASQLELSGARAAKEAAEARERSAELAAKAQAQEQQLSQLRAELLTLQRRVALLTKERDGLTRVLEASDSEVAQAQGRGMGGRGGASTASSAQDEDEEAAEQHRTLKARIKMLEDVIKELELQLSAYRAEHGVSPPPHPEESPAKPLPSVLTLLSQLVHARRELTHVESLVADLSEKVEWVNRHYPSLLDREHGQLRVITLPDNPSHARLRAKGQREAAEAQRELQIEKLRGEEMRAELERLRAGAGGSASAAPSLAATAGAPSSSTLLALESQHASRVQALESSLAAAQKTAQRMKDIFSTRVTEFRQTCYALTGYKIELVSAATGTYRLKSMYAEAAEDHLLFKLTQQPTPAAGAAATSAEKEKDPPGLSVLETDFTARLDAQTTHYLSNMHSIPGFLAAVQLNLLEKQTKMR